MGYVDKHLLEGEKVVYRARLHRIIFLPPLALAVLGLVVAVLVNIYLENREAAGIVGAAFLIVAILVAFPRYIRYATSEFAVTNKRVIVKVGLIYRDTLELVLAKVETIGVDQTVLGRILNYGTITVTGTGGTKKPFKDIARPIEFRERVQSQLA
ncbi:MAG: PH domain-containing protein [Acidobacteriota bacterium]